MPHAVWYDALSASRLAHPLYEDIPIPPLPLFFHFTPLSRTPIMLVADAFDVCKFLAKHLSVDKPLVWDWT